METYKSEARDFWTRELELTDDVQCTYYVSSPRISKGIAAKYHRVPYGTLQIIMRKGSTEYHSKMMKWISLLSL